MGHPTFRVIRQSCRAYSLRQPATIIRLSANFAQSLYAFFTPKNPAHPSLSLYLFAFKPFKCAGFFVSTRHRLYTGAGFSSRPLPFRPELQGGFFRRIGELS